MISFGRILLFFLAATLHAEEAGKLVVEGWQHRVWSVYPLEKVNAEEELPLTPKADGVELSAARGEREPFILILRGNIPLRDVKIVASDLRSEAGSVLPAQQFSFQRIGYVYVDEPSGTRIKQPMPYPVGTGQYPDPLLENRGDVRPKHNLQFLVTLAVPRETKPGRYAGRVKIQFRKEAWMPPGLASEEEVPLQVRIRSFALPARSPLLNTSFANLRELPEAQRTPERVAEFQLGCIQHDQAPEPLAASPRITIDPAGNLHADTTDWEKAVAANLDLGRTHFFIPVWDFFPAPAHPQGLYFLYHYPAVIGQKWFGAPICAVDRSLTPEFRRLFGAYLAQIYAVLERRGWLDRAFITTMDEPYTYHTSDRLQDTPANNYEVVRNFVAFVRQTAPGLRTFCTADPVDGLTGFIDHWCLRNLDHAAEAKVRADQHGEVFTFCDNYRTFIDYPAVSARSFGWLAWKIGAQGWLTYETLGSYRTAWEAPVLVYAQFSGATVWGMGQMFYPDPLSGAPLPSLRWELMREGCDDYEYLWLLGEALKAQPNVEAKRLLEEAAATVVRSGGDAETMAQSNTANATSNLVVHRLREKIGDWIEKLQKPNP